MKLGWGAAVAASAAMSFASPALAADDAFLRIDGISGESRAVQGALDLKSWSYLSGHGAPESTAPSHGGDRAGVREIVITKEHDQASPKLMRAAASGEHFRQATLYIRNASGQPYLQYRMENVAISNYSMSSGGDRPTESMTLIFEKIEVVNEGPPQRPAVERDAVPQATRLTPPGHY